MANESTRAKGGAASGSGKTARRTKAEMEKKLNLKKLGESYSTITPKQYLERMIGILKDEA